MQKRKRKIGKKIIIFSIILMCLATEAFGKTYYVATSGNNRNAGTEAQPWATIQYAHDKVAAGDTVIVKDGKYTESYDSNKMVQISKSGTANNWITFKSQNKWGAVLDGASLGEETYYGFFLVNGAKYIRFENFELKNLRVGFRANGTKEGALTNIYVYGCKIHDMDFGGVLNASMVDYFTIDSSVIYNIRKAEERDGGHQYYHNHCLYLKGRHNLVTNNTLYEPQGGVAIRLDGYSGTKMSGDDWSFKVLNNVMSGTKSYTAAEGLISFYRAKDATYSPNRVIIKDNVFIDPPGGKAIRVGMVGNNCSNPLSHWTPSKTEINGNKTNADIMLDDCRSSLTKSYSNNVVNATGLSLNNTSSTSSQAGVSTNKPPPPEDLSIVTK